MTPRADLANDLVDDVPLSDHRVLRIRPVRQCDFEPVRQLYRRLSPRSRYLRFFSPMRSLPESVLRLITCVDYRRQVALVAELTSELGGEVVAFANFAANDEGAAEVALVVGDEWQRQGIGTILAAKLVDAASARGFDRFVANVLWENGAVMRKLITHVGEVVSGSTRSGVLELSFVRRYYSSFDIRVVRGGRLQPDLAAGPPKGGRHVQIENASLASLSFPKAAVFPAPTRGGA